MSERTPTSENHAGQVLLDNIYTEIRAGIRETDNISFRLLGLVPLVSGAALIGVTFRSPLPPAPLLILLALFAAGITLGLFRWELRNVQTCSWLLRYAEAVERHALAAQGMQTLVRSRPSAPQRVGKTEAEKFIYAITICAWLALPPALGLVKGEAAILYYPAAGLIAAATLLTIAARVRVPVIQVPSDSGTSAVGTGTRAG